MRNRQLRDLEWAVRSPPLMHAGGPYPGDEFFAALTIAATDPDIPEPRHRHHFRLGQHFEKIWQHWLSASSDYQLRHANLQVNEHKRTVGEFDFLLTKNDQVEHWELAVKFYLGVGDRTQLLNWYGPNTADRLGTKIERLNTHQLVLSEHDAARELLKKLDMNVDQVRCIVKGRLFHPYKDFINGTLTVPASVNPNHEHGWWMTLEDFSSSRDTDRFVLLEKIDWLAPLTDGDVTEVRTRDEMLDYLSSEQAEQATHIAILDTEDNEESRGFVVNESWLTRTANH